MSAARLLPAALLFAAGAAAQHGEFCRCGQPSQLPLAFEIDSADAGFRDQIRVAAQRWNRYANLFRVRDGDGDGALNGANEVLFLDRDTVFERYGLFLGDDVFAITALTPFDAFGSPPFNQCPVPFGTRCGVFSETDVLFNADFFRGWTAAPPNLDDTGPASYVSTALHEFGHTFGLHHTFDALTAMNYYSDFGAQYLGLGDADAARDVNPGRRSTDLALLPFLHNGGFQSAGFELITLNRFRVAAGAPLTVRNITVENLGSNALDNVALTFYLSVDDRLDGGDRVIGTLRWDRFDGWWDSREQTFTIPDDVAPGDYRVAAAVSYDNGRADAVVYNNVWIADAARALTVVPAQPGFDGGGLLNLSTNTAVSSEPAIAGFIVRGGPRRLVLLAENEAGLSDPALELTDRFGNPLGLFNDDWRDLGDAAALVAQLGRRPRGDSDAMIGVTLDAGVYLAWMWDLNGRSGRGNVQLLDVDAVAGDLAGGRLINISTNSVIDATGAIAGFIVSGEPQRFVILGEDIAGMDDPVLELTDIGGRPLGVGNDDWRDWPGVDEVVAELGRTPTGERDALIAVELEAGVYLAVLRDKNRLRNGRGNVQVQQLER